VARQVFHDESILAFLPLSDPHLCSIVWSLPPEQAERMQQMSDDEFNQALCVAFDNRLGLCRVESERQLYPGVMPGSLQATDWRWWGMRHTPFIRSPVRALTSALWMRRS